MRRIHFIAAVLECVFDALAAIALNVKTFYQIREDFRTGEDDDRRDRRRRRPRSKGRRPFFD
jgi:hypothetical protein